jgi:hypothetical protein
MKKKKKRDADPARQDYARILKESGIEEHETEHTVKSDVLQASNDPDAEAHAVAAALGLSVRFDPTLKPFDEVRHSKKNSPGIPDTPNETSPVGSRSTSPTQPRKNSRLSEQLEVPTLSGGEDSSENDEDEEDEDEEGEFEAVPGHTLLSHDAEEQLQKKQRLHLLEMQEAAALAAGRKGSTASGDTGSSGSGTGVAPPDEAEDEDEDEMKNEE